MMLMLLIDWYRNGYDHTTYLKSKVHKNVKKKPTTKKNKTKKLVSVITDFHFLALSIHYSIAKFEVSLVDAQMNGRGRKTLLFNDRVRKIRVNYRELDTQYL